MPALDLGDATRVLTPPGTATFDTVPFGDMDLVADLPNHPAITTDYGRAIPRGFSLANVSSLASSSLFTVDDNWVLFVAIEGEQTGGFPYPVLDFGGSETLLVLNPNAVLAVGIAGRGFDTTPINELITDGFNTGVRVFALAASSTRTALICDQYGVLATGAAALPTTPDYLFVIAEGGAPNLLGMWLFEGVEPSDTDVLLTAQTIAGNAPPRVVRASTRFEASLSAVMSAEVSDGEDLPPLPELEVGGEVEPPEDPADPDEDLYP